MEKQQSKAEQYRQHVLKAQEFSGSIRDYCRQNNLTQATYYHYRKELGLAKRPKRKFVKVRSLDSTKVPLKENFSEIAWLAKFLKEYSSLR